MLKIEKRIIDFCGRYYIILGFGIVTILALVARLCLLRFQSIDYMTCLEPWFNYFKENGGLRGLANYPGDYGAPYMTIMALLSYIPINPLYLIKGVSILFDFVLAVTAVMLVREVSAHQKRGGVYYCWQPIQ